MPFTPYHFGPSAVLAIPLDRKIDVPVFILANVIIDIEPLMVMLFGFNYPLHGYAHTLVGAAVLGLSWGVAAHALKGPIGFVTNNILKFPYEPTLGKALHSGLLGAWFHVLLDMPLYPDIKPFFPLDRNPLYGSVPESGLYMLCAVCFVPALVLYLYRIMKMGIPLSQEP